MSYEIIENNTYNYSYIDKTGKAIIDLPQLADTSYSFSDIPKRIYDFSDHVARIFVDNKFEFIDKNGKVVLKPECEFVSDFKNGKARAYNRGRYYFIDKTGNEISD